MVEGTLHVEGEVVHVIVQRCYDFSKLLRQLTPSLTNDPSILTLAYADETSIFVHAQSNKPQIKEVKKENVFHGGRNFK